ncbi:MAG: hydroxymethylglutaryl-CoA reductase [Candidatus Neomarinimicrobiota bacterium]|nr:hydroxymethylglutaryl-CoA reductase [Candidatus Neomarinimicrobiota bacterium]
MKENNKKMIPTGYANEDTDKRLDWLSDKIGFNYDTDLSTTPEDLKGIIENHIGFMKIPMAVAGPLKIEGKYANGEYYVPICTLEGTLALSMTRGMIATHRCDGIQVSHIKQELSRAPVFTFDNLNKSADFMSWIDKNFKEIKSVAESTTNHGKLLRIDQYPIQNSVILDFILDTGNAAGQNMVTLAAKTSCDYIKEKTGAEFFLESGFNSDKKASARNMIMGRGHSVIAETTISNSVIRSILDVDISNLKKYQEIGPTTTRLAGTEGCHLHISNALTAIYLATGQDTACVAENSIGHYQIEPQENDVKFRLTLPSMTIGTVGGGTRLSPQQQNLKLLGCDTGDTAARKLAEIICASALALEISLFSALASHTFTRAHMKYGR